jgi:L-cysteine/cystine lyase
MRSNLKVLLLQRFPPPANRRQGRYTAAHPRIQTCGLWAPPHEGAGPSGRRLRKWLAGGVDVRRGRGSGNIAGVTTLARAVRCEFPALSRETYLNTGAAGPLPRVATDAVAARVAHAARNGRMSLREVAVFEEAHEDLRTELAVLLAAPPAEVSLTTSVTAGLGQAIWGIDWRTGDEAITTSLEHPALIVPLMNVARRHGVRLRFVALETGVEPLEDRVDELAGPRTRLVALSHVAWTTGARMDVEGAARAGHRYGAVVLVDGAQAVGAIPVAPRELGADAYALPAQKWLLGPEGIGALWVATEALDRVDVTFGGMASGAGHRADGTFELHPDARRYELGLLPEILVPGWIAALRWLSDLRDPSEPAGPAGWELLHRRTAEAAATARRYIEAVGARVITPPGRQAGLIAFQIGGVDPEAAATALEKRGVIIRWIPEPRALRASIGWFNDDDDIGRLANRVAALGG